MNDKIEELQQFLSSFPAGKIGDKSELPRLVERCWDLLNGSKEQGMAAEKLDRMKKCEWYPPLLTFVIERHGGTVQGSSRAELQTWTINLEEKTASCDLHPRFRQLIPKDAALKVDPIAEDIQYLILNGKDDTRLVWSPERSEVRVLVSEFITGKFEKTVLERRKRFRAALDRKLERSGWSRVPKTRDVYKQK